MKFIIFGVIAVCGSASAQLTINGFNGLTASISSNGDYAVSLPSPLAQLKGNVGAPVFNSHVATGADNIGAYQQLAFSYSAGTSNRSASIRAYTGKPLAAFAVAWNNASANIAPFPVFAQPANLFHLSFNGVFSAPTFTQLTPDSPWVFFDGAANTFIISPASNYMVAATTPGAGNQIQAGISSQITTLPAGFTHQTVLAFGHGINQTFAVWGQALTDISGKARPKNDADVLLKQISYWTDNQSTYYYNPGGSSYTGSLEAVKAEFDAKGITLGSLQLDSWWYPKGPDNSWSSRGGIWAYTASSSIFQPDLATFQKSLGVPLTTHARWIDAASPYHGQYAFSGNVIIDPSYWEDRAAYLESSCVTTYEQDWLASNAQTNFNLSDPYAFLDNMAIAMANHKIDVQYCMATPKHFLQTTRYNNLKTVRTSQDGFGQTRWTDFLYASRFAGALGVWPFSDVLMSSDVDSLLLATLSGGPVGIGDKLGAISAENLLQSVRADGVIVKPDAPAAPIDDVFISDAQGIDTPMVTATNSDFSGTQAYYIAAYVRNTASAITIAPVAYGISGAAYLYDYKKGSGHLIAANSSTTINLGSNASYFILVPVGESGVGFLGDKGHFVTLGKRRIPAFTDTGRALVTVEFASGEHFRTLFGYSPQPVSVKALKGWVESPTWDSSTQLFTVHVHPAKGERARVEISLSSSQTLSGTPR